MGELILIAMLAVFFYILYRFAKFFSDELKTIK